MRYINARARKIKAVSILTSKEIDERIKKVQQQNDKLRNDISLFRSKLKNNQNVLRDLKAENDKMYV